MIFFRFKVKFAIGGLLFVVILQVSPSLSLKKNCWPIRKMFLLCKDFLNVLFASEFLIRIQSLAYHALWDINFFLRFAIYRLFCLHFACNLMRDY